MNYRIGRLLLALVTLLAATQVLNADTETESELDKVIKTLTQKGLTAHKLPISDFHKGVEPKDFLKRTGASYKPSYNEEPFIPAQCWIETAYGTQNACLYCHTNYLARIEHGNAFPLAEDQILYSFPTPNLNKVLWRNTIFPKEISERLAKERIPIPDIDDSDYVRQDNWSSFYDRIRAKTASKWINEKSDEFVLFPALNPNHLYPWQEKNPTSNGVHGYICREGFVRNEKAELTGWRSVNFFSYGIFTPLSGSVSGIYIRLPEKFMKSEGKVSIATYKKNLDLLEKNIKNRTYKQTHYYGDASDVEVKGGFYPVGTEFVHPLHYVDLNADGEMGKCVDGIVGNSGFAYEFPGTRAKRIKEMRYMYKWKEVGLEDIDEDAHDDDYIIGYEGQGWVDNNAGWLLSGFIEDRKGKLRAQTTEELAQCMGCHGRVGNTVDSVWSFQRKLPGDAGWREMDYGTYDSNHPLKTKLTDYVKDVDGVGELGYFYHSVVGADLYGLMPGEVGNELKAYSVANIASLDLKHKVSEIFDDDQLKNMEKADRKSRLKERQKVMRAYVATLNYLYHDNKTNSHYIKGNLLYPSKDTMKTNIQLYRKIVLDQSYNLGKDVFGYENENVPFTFRSDGTVKSADGKIIPVGQIITSRPYNEEGEGITPTGIVKLNEDGEPVDKNGKSVNIESEPEKAVGHVSTGGTFDTMYNPILGDQQLKPLKPAELVNE